MQGFPRFSIQTIVSFRAIVAGPTIGRLEAFLTLCNVRESGNSSAAIDLARGDEHSR
ncbi:hypothetical protein GCM10025778_31190 [Paeniglutamicibacter antarcticus]|uniref:Uncharacterized protein n=1 Tax=Paeniglutamicibacter antarcticus TaxID=494023 RepID=A0ABP9TQC8_9MICC